MQKGKDRHSRQRDAVYEYLCSTKEHPSAEMVYTHLREQIPNISLGTVYRNLNKLEEMGKIQVVANFKNTERYDARCDSHAHFVCEKCGKVEDLSEMNLQRAMEACGAGKNPEIGSVSCVHVMFRGVCAECSGNCDQSVK